MTTTASPTLEQPVQVAGGCPSCGSGGNVLFTVELSHGAADRFRPDYFGVIPETGDTITRCDNCATFFVHADDGSFLGQPTTTPTSAAAPDDEWPFDTEDDPTEDDPTDDDPAATIATQAAQIAELEKKLAAAKKPAPRPRTKPKPAARPRAAARPPKGGKNGTSQRS